MLRTDGKTSEYLPISPIALNCPRCKAKPGKACHKLNDELDVVHVERIALAAAEDVKPQKAREK